MNVIQEIEEMQTQIAKQATQIKLFEQENEKLRKLNAEIVASHEHAKADLIHYQNVFAASACMEAMHMCKEFFNITHDRMRDRANESIKRMVEDKQQAETENRMQAVEQASAEINEVCNMLEPEAPQSPFVEPTIKPSDPWDTGDGCIQPPPDLTYKAIKKGYASRLGYVPQDWMHHPKVPMINSSPDGLAWLRERHKASIRSSVSRTVLSIFVG